MGKGASTDIVLSSTFEVFCAGRKDEDSPAARIKNNVLIFMVYNNWTMQRKPFLFTNRLYECPYRWIFVRISRNPYVCLNSF